MTQVDWLFWAIGFLFYLPMHAGAPLLYILLQGDIERLKREKNRLLIHSLLSAVVAFLLAALIWAHSQWIAILILVIAAGAPWLSVWKSNTRESF